MPVVNSPFWMTVDRDYVKLYHGNVTDVLARLHEKSVHCVVTSPPYWGLRDYGVDGQLGSEPSPDCGTHGQAQCGKCFVCAMVAVFREVRRVLRDDGTLWLNLGDSYASRTDGSTGGIDDAIDRLNGETRQKRQTDRSVRSDKPKSGIPSGNLVGVPWRVALALQTDGWVLRQDVIWHKPSPMPESVRNRCTKAHEYVFLLTKSQRYFCDMEAIREVSKTAPDTKTDYQSKKDSIKTGEIDYHSQRANLPDGRSNKRSVWTVSSEGYEGAHFATFPPKLITPMILAGTSEHGCCADCGAPWERVTERTKVKRDRPNEYVKRTGEEGTGNVYNQTNEGVSVKTLGWQPTCDCKRAETVPCVVLDPFVGSGTTCCVAAQHGRRSIGIDLNDKYLTTNAVVRIKGTLGSIPALAPLVPKKLPPKVIGPKSVKRT